MASSPPRSPQPRPSLVWPVVLIGIGVLFLLSNLGVLSENVWLPILRLWPLLLVLIGIEILVGRRSPAASTFAALLLIVVVGCLIATLVFFPNNPAVQSLSSPIQQLKQEVIQYELGTIETANIHIQWNPGRGSLEALGTESPYIIAGTVTYLNNFNASVNTRNDRTTIKLNANESTHIGFDFLDVDWSDSQWDLKLHPNVIYDLELDAGSGDFEFILDDLQISNLKMDTGSGHVQVVLPLGDYTVEIDSDSGSLDVSIPSPQPARLEVDGGSGALHLSSNFTLTDGAADGDGSWETENYEKDKGILIKLDMGSSEVNITR